MVNQLSEKLRQTIKPSSVESLLQFQPGNRFLRMKYYQQMLLSYNCSFQPSYLTSRFDNQLLSFQMMSFSIGYHFHGSYGPDSLGSFVVLIQQSNPTLIKPPLPYKTISTSLQPCPCWPNKAQSGLFTTRNRSYTWLSKYICDKSFYMKIWNRRIIYYGKKSDSITMVKKTLHMLHM